MLIYSKVHENHGKLCKMRGKFQYVLCFYIYPTLSVTKRSRFKCSLETLCPLHEKRISKNSSFIFDRILKNHDHGLSLFYPLTFASVQQNKMPHY